MKHYCESAILRSSLFTMGFSMILSLTEEGVGMKMESSTSSFFIIDSSPLKNPSFIATCRSDDTPFSKTMM